MHNMHRPDVNEMKSKPQRRLGEVCNPVELSSDSFLSLARTLSVSLSSCLSFFFFHLFVSRFFVQSAASDFQMPQSVASVAKENLAHCSVHALLRCTRNDFGRSAHPHTLLPKCQTWTTGGISIQNTSEFTTINVDCKYAIHVTLSICEYSVSWF